MMRRHYLILSLLTFLMMVPALSANAQKAERKSIRKGNKVYDDKKYTEAEIAYLKALQVNPKSKVATYNLGNALFKQQKTKEALEKYQLAFSQEKDPKKLAAITHNAANAYMALNDYSNAVGLYRQSLRLNPTDDETRYNLAVAQALLRKQQQQQKKNKKDKDKDDNKDKNKDQQDQQQQQQQQQDDQKKRQQQQQQQQQKDQQEQVSKEKAQQLLDALMQDEKDTQDKVKKLQLQQSRGKNPEKDW